MDPATGYLYAYREYLKGGLASFDHANNAVGGFKAVSRGEKVMKRVGGSNTEDGWREAFTAAGWAISKPRLLEVEAGINAVYGWFQQNKLFIFDDMHLLLDEIESYSRELDESYQPTERIHNKSAYHLLDALRYLLVDFGPERVPGQNVRIPVTYHAQGRDDPWSRRMQGRKDRRVVRSRT